MTPRRSSRPLLLSLLALVPFRAAEATDGVIEINQARAMAGEITTGDGMGFPVSLTQSGSYRLTGNLDVTGVASPETVTAILITASFVTLDLNGFSLRGPAVCTGFPVSSCAPSGGGIGIDSHVANHVRISNGIVRGFGNMGIYAGNAIIEAVQVFGNAATGLWLSAGGQISDSAAIQNGFDGFAGAGVIATRSRSVGNKLAGFYLDPGEIRDCEAAGNGGYGINIGAGLATENVSRGNVDCAIRGPGGGYARNNVSGAVTLCLGTEIGENICNGTATCP
jgi:hypothetical protein